MKKLPYKELKKLSKEVDSDIVKQDRWYKAGYDDGFKDGLKHSLPAFPVISETFKKKYQLEGARLLADKIFYSLPNIRGVYSAKDAIEVIAQKIENIFDELEKETK